MGLQVCFLVHFLRFKLLPFLPVNIFFHSEETFHTDQVLRNVGLNAPVLLMCDFLQGLVEWRFAWWADQTNTRVEWKCGTWESGGWFVMTIGIWRTRKSFANSSGTSEYEIPPNLRQF